MDSIEGRPITPYEAESFYVIPKGVFNVINTFLQNKVPGEYISIRKTDIVKGICDSEGCTNLCVDDRKWIKCALQRY